MAEKIKIAELSIDNKALVSSMQETKAAISETAEELKKMKGTTDENSESFIRNEARLKDLKSEYNAQQKVLQATTVSQKKHTEALNKEIKSIDDAAKNNKELKNVRNQLNTSTEEGAKALIAINKKIDENTDFIKSNISAQEKQTANVGNYGSAINKAKLLTIAFGAALKAAGIGLIVLAVSKLTEAFGRNQKVMDVINITGKVFARVMNDIVSFLVDNTGGVIKFMKSIFSDPQESVKKLGDLIKANIIERFESALEVMGFLGSAAKKFFSGDFAGALDDAKKAGDEFVDVLTGVDNTLDKAGNAINGAVDALTKYGKEVLATATAQAELEKGAAIAIAQNKIILEQYDRQAEQLRQIRDDVSKTFEERIAANTKLGSVLNEQEKLMIKNADLVIANAAAQNELNNNTESYVALLEAQGEKAGVLAFIEGKRSEQIVNRVGLIKEESEALEAATALEIEQDKLKKEALAEQAQIDSDNKLAALQANLDNEIAVKNSAIDREFSDRKAKLDKAKSDELKTVAKFGADEAKINAKYAKFNQDLKREEFTAKLDGAAAVTNGLAGFLDEESTAGKAVAVSSAIINVAQGVTKAIAEGGLAGLLTGAIVAATGAISIGKILGTKKPKAAKVSAPKFARGGILSGASHANGGISTPFGELEGGEAVINKRSTALFRPILSRLNAAGGGQRFASGGILGDVGTGARADIIDYERLGATVAEANKSLPNPVVGVDEVVSVASRVSVIETAGNF